MEKILELKHISHAYHTPKGETPALQDISFSVGKGEFIAIMGPSGCGKSTLLSLIAGLLKPESGEIMLHGMPVIDCTEKIGYMLQRDELLEWRSIFRNVLLGPEIRGTLSTDTKEKAHDLLSAYGLGQFEHSRPSELSGGMRQRAALVRTLILNPEILLLDEPFSALDYQTRLNVSDDIGQIIRKEQTTAILVTHDLSEAISLADRILVLSRRPAVIKYELKLEFSSLGTSDDTPLNRRNAAEFKTYFNLIWKELNQDERSSY